MTTLIEEIANARVDVAEAEAALNHANRVLKGLLDTKARDEYGVFVGCVAKSGKFRVIVTDINHKFFDPKPRISGHLIKKDGSRSDVIRNLYTGWKVETDNG